MVTRAPVVARGLFLAVAIPVLVAGAGSCAPAPASPEPRTSVSPGETWDTMSKERRLDYMNTTVMTRMREVFVGFDPHRYAKVSCATCHGKDGPSRGYAMPNPSLLLEPSPWNTTSAAPEAAPSEMDAFMARVVAPEMARLLGRTPSRERGTSSSSRCFTCHTADE